MPRSNRPRGGKSQSDDDEFDLARVLVGRSFVERKNTGRWNVQPIAAASSTKTYTCPGCTLDIAPGTAHVVAWRADGLMGDDDDIAARRHWHSHCWSIAR